MCKLFLVFSVAVYDVPYNDLLAMKIIRIMINLKVFDINSAHPGSGRYN